MNFLRPPAECFVPDSQPAPQALSQCTHLCIAAHQDDIEILAYPGITQCYNHSKNSFVGVVVTDGAGSIREDQHQHLSAQEYSEVRRKEQRNAATIGHYTAMIQLGLSSANVKGHSESLISDLEEIILLTQPHTLYLHSPADRHETHVALLMRCIEALRRLPPKKVPQKIYGCEVWGSLDWLPRHARIPLDSGDLPDLASELLVAFSSQIEGGKRYDLGTLGRRQGNATFTDPYSPDPSKGITWAVDLAPFLQKPYISVQEFCKKLTDEFSIEVQSRIHKFT